MRKLIALILALLMLTVVVSAQAPYVMDPSGLLTKEAAQALESSIDKIHKDYGFTISIVTASTFGEKTVDAYAQQCYKTYEYENDGIMLLVSEEEGQWYIYTSGLCATVIPDADAAQIGASLMDGLQSGDYAGTFQRFVELVSKPVCEKLDAQAQADLALRRAQSRYAVLGMVFGLLFGVAVTIALACKIKTGRFFPWVKKHAPEEAVPAVPEASEETADP